MISQPEAEVGRYINTNTHAQERDSNGELKSSDLTVEMQMLIFPC